MVLWFSLWKSVDEDEKYLLSFSPEISGYEKESIVDDLMLLEKISPIDKLKLDNLNIILKLENNQIYVFWNNIKIPREIWTSITHLIRIISYFDIQMQIENNHKPIDDNEFYKLMKKLEKFELEQSDYFCKQYNYWKNIGQIVL